MGNYGIKISKEGFDALDIPTEATKKNFVILDSTEAHKLEHKGFFSGTNYTWEGGTSRLPIFFGFVTDSASNPTWFEPSVDIVANPSTGQLEGLGNPGYAMIFKEGYNVGSLTRAIQGDIGIKIMKQGKDPSSETVSDYVFTSQLQSLPLLYKVSLTISVTGASCSGTSTYNHNLGWFPFVFGAVTTISAGRQLMPLGVPITEAGNKLYCSGDNLSEDFSMRITKTSVTITYDVHCTIPMVGNRCPDTNKDYTVDLYFGMFELGS